MKPQPTTHASRLALDDIIPHLRKARVITRNGLRQVIACCPAHDDNTPSLSITEKPDGTLLWHCFAGCSQEMVQRELERLAGVQRGTVKLIPPRQKQSATTRPLLLYELAQAKRVGAVKLLRWKVREQSEGGVAIPYITREKELHAVRYRLALEGENRFRWREGDTPILYGLWRLPEWGDADTIYLCEGESDTWTLWEVDLPALGIPGASMWKPEWWRELDGFQRIVLIPDTDKAGAELAQKLANTCPFDLTNRVYVLRLPDGVKDVNELWQRENANPERFKQVLGSCAVEPLTAIPTEDEEQELVLVLGHTRERDVAHAIVPNLLYAERITILAGEAGVGKTTFALEIADGLTRTGKLWNGTVAVQHARVLWLDFDHDWSRLQEIVDAYYGECEREIYTIPREQLVPLEPKTLSLYRRAIERFGIDIIIADTAFDWLAVQDANDETEARVKLQLVRELIAGTGCGVLLLHHLRKSAGDGASTMALSGAHRWAAKVDVVAYLRHLNRDGQDSVKLIVPKDRDGERRELEFMRQARRFIPLEREAVPTGDWGVVKAYLQAHGEATYRELLDALSQAGMRTTEGALRKRVKRWENRGLVIVERRGFPPTAFVKLAVVQLAHFGQPTPPTVQNVQNVQNGEGALEEEASEQPDSLSHNFVQNGHNGQNGTPTSIPTDGSNFANSDILDDSDILDTSPNAVQNAVQIDATTIFALAAERGFPQLVVEYPDGKSRLHIAGTREGWEQAIPYLQRDGVLPIAYHALCNPPSEPPPPEPLPELPAVFQNRTPLGWDLIDEFLQSASNPDNPFPLEPTELEQVRVMLAYAEANNFPELTLTEYGYTIRGDMAGWITAAQLMAGTPAVPLTTRMLIAYAQRNSNRELATMVG